MGRRVSGTHTTVLQLTKAGQNPVTVLSGRRSHHVGAICGRRSDRAPR